MFLELEFEELEKAFELELEQVTEISDGGFERGYAEGYAKGDADGQATGRVEGESIGFADALAKRTELVVTDSGEYVPEGESTGFKKVTVGIQKGEDLDAVIAEQAELIEELSATLDEKIGAYDVGYDAALEKLTDLVVTENGEYTPSEESTGFKSVSVNVQAEGGNRLALYISKTLTELNEDDFGSATSVADTTFNAQTMIETVVIPSAVKTLGSYAFGNMTALRKVEIKGVISKMSDYTFYQDKNLSEIDISKITNFGRYSFAYTGLTSITIVANTNQATFQNCESLVEVTITSNVTNIYMQTFYGCKALETVTVNATKPPTLGSSAFSNCAALKKIAVPIGCGDAYRQATNWSAYADIIVEEAM